MLVHVDRQPCLMLEQDSQERATKRPANATWQSSFRGLHGYGFLTTALDLQFDQSRGNKSLSRIFLENNLLGKDGYHERSLFTTRRSQSKSAGPHKHKRECCRVALSSATMPKPRGKAFKRARFETLIHMTRKRRFAIARHEVACSMQLRSTRFYETTRRGHGTSLT